MRNSPGGRFGSNAARGTDEGFISSNQPETGYAAKSFPRRRLRGFEVVHEREAAPFGVSPEEAVTLLLGTSSTGIGPPVCRWRSRCGKATVIPCSAKLAASIKRKSLETWAAFAWE